MKQSMSFIFKNSNHDITLCMDYNSFDRAYVVRLYFNGGTARPQNRYIDFLTVGQARKIVRAVMERIFKVGFITDVFEELAKKFDRSVRLV